MDDFDTLLLRFRDLSTSPGETIRLHRSICNAKRSTWWGWWHKGFEKAPNTAFKRTKLLANKGRLSVILFNSGSLTFFEATVDDLVSGQGGKSIPSPNRLLTPSYYRNRTCLAWFSVRNIRELPEDAAKARLRPLRHVEVPALFTAKWKRDEFADLNDTPIGQDARKIESQSRTIWFLRGTRTAKGGKS